MILLPSFKGLNLFPYVGKRIFLVAQPCEKTQCSKPTVGPSFGGFHKWGYPKNGRFIRENPIKMDDLGVPLF